MPVHHHLKPVLSLVLLYIVQFVPILNYWIVNNTWKNLTQLAFLLSFIGLQSLILVGYCVNITSLVPFLMVTECLVSISLISQGMFMLVLFTERVPERAFRLGSLVFEIESFPAMISWPGLYPSSETNISTAWCVFVGQVLANLILLSSLLYHRKGLKKH